MESCPTCNLKHKRKIKDNHELSNTHIAANNQYYCEQGKGIKKLADKRSYLQSEEYENIWKSCTVRPVKKI